MQLLLQCLYFKVFCNLVVDVRYDALPEQGHLAGDCFYLFVVFLQLDGVSQLARIHVNRLFGLP